jgi:ABC-type transporter Mla MlaB component
MGSTNMSTKTSLSLGESLNILQASKLYSRAEISLQKSSTIELKADAVQIADSAGLQLILSLKKEVDTCGGKLSWKNPSLPLLESARLLGLFEDLGLHN